ncbi:MAG: phosphoenolpyruvate-utilizing protein [Deltaproteobacteria bacterium]|nr:phosphoenolpyruvate-utilizing protein [Deltaproteobacteria bacterium]MBW2127795.1 phosphoenolpyruvate-utilizing protein [Deltaproteobacteria bacterium]MBW2302079.1 phosphoenolpyruvate-utilizing protein [Deltaproteobacteria bacterium]
MKVYDVVPGLEFDPENDFEQSPAWFLDGTHSVPPWTPMFGWFWINFCRHGMQYGAEKLSLPTVKGWDWRFHNGGGYLTLLLVKSEEERQRREAKFREAILPFIEDYDGLWQGFLKEILERYENLKKLDLEKASNIELLENFEETINTCRRMWEIHMYMMYGTYTAYILFENMCRDLAGIDDTSPVFHKLVSGFDNKVFQVDRRLWEFSKRAREEGLTEEFLQSEPEQIQERLESTEKGRAFMEDFMAFMNEDGWRMQRMSEINLPTWVEDPAPALANVKQFLLKGGDFNLDEERKKLTEEREAAEREVLEKVSPEQRGWFEQLMRLAQKSGVFSEEHDHYLDLYTHAMMRRSALGIGRRFVSAGTIDHHEDIFFLIPDEVRRAAINPDQFNLRYIVDRRKAEWEEWKKNPNPPAFLKEGFDLDQAMGVLVQSNDPIALKVVVGSMPQVRPELKADLYGTCGSPGVAEGPARVIMNEDELHLVKEGDILVAASTSPSWTPIFSMIKGVVVDRGASLSHAAIVGREYGIPVVMNVFEGTVKIKSGQRIKVDANLGTVYILDKEK